MSGYPPDTTLASRLIGNWWALKAVIPPFRAGEGVMTSLGDWDLPGLRNQFQ